MHQQWLELLRDVFDKYDVKTLHGKIADPEMSHLWLLNDDEIATGCTYKEFQEDYDNFAKIEFIASS